MKYKYLVENGVGYVVQMPEMEQPDEDKYDSWSVYSDDTIAYNKHIAGLLKYKMLEPYPAFEGREDLEQEKDFQIRLHPDANKWISRTEQFPATDIAIPLQSKVEDVKEEGIDLKENEYLDFTKMDITDEAKSEFVKNVTGACAKELLKTFLGCGLKTHIEQMIVEQNSGQEFLLTFQTVRNYLNSDKVEPVKVESELPDGYSNIKELVDDFNSNLKRALEIAKERDEFRERLNKVKSDAVEFAEWCADSDKYSRVRDEQGINIWIDQDTPVEENSGDYYIYTTEQLYQLFRKSR